MRNYLLLFVFVFGCVPADNQVQSLDLSQCQIGWGGACSSTTIPSMPLAQTPATTPTFPATISPPYDGDPLSATQLRTDDLTPLQNGVEAARLMLYRGISVKPGLRSTNGTTVDMRGIPAMVVTAGGIWTVKGPIATQTFAVADLEGGGAFANNTHYYMYLYLSGGVVTKQISLTAPDAYNTYKTGSTDYAYVGTFRIDGSGVILPFAASKGRYTYTQAVGQAAGTGLNATAYTAVSLANYVPPTSQTAMVFLRLSAVAADNADLSVRTAGYTAAGYTGGNFVQRKIWSNGANGEYTGVSEIALDSSQQIEYKISTVAAGSVAAIYVAGYDER